MIKQTISYFCTIRTKIISLLDLSPTEPHTSDSYYVTHELSCPEDA